MSAASSHTNRVALFSLDRSLLGDGVGDGVRRHRRYAQSCASLDIIVLAPRGFRPVQLSASCAVYPTGAAHIFGHAWAAMKIFRSLVARYRIDLVVTQDLLSPVALLLARRYRIPLLISVHGVWWDQWFLRKRFWHRFLTCLIFYALRRAAAIRVVSDTVKHALIARGVRRAAIHVISTPVEIQRFYRPASSSSEPSPERLPHVLSVGRLEREKRLDHLLQAWKKVIARVPHARLFIVGDGSQRHALTALTQTLALTESVFFAGAVPTEEIPSYYHNAAVFALTSESESFGKVLVEAGAAQLPAVATATLGAQSIIQPDVTGFLVPVGDTNLIAEKIIQLLTDHLLASTMGTAARAHIASSYDWEKNIQKVVRLWKQTIQR